MTDKAKRAGMRNVYPEMYLRQNSAASEECPFQSETCSGLTMRGYFSAMAMQGFITVSQTGDSPEDCAKMSVLFADALLEELEKDV